MQKITVAEIAAEDTELLPVRETMLANLGSFNISVVGASNTALAVNALTWGSASSATALQGVTVVQG